MRKYFGTDGIRNVANTRLTPELAYNVAENVMKYIEQNKL